MNQEDSHSLTRRFKFMRLAVSLHVCLRRRGAKEEALVLAIEEWKTRPIKKSQTTPIVGLQ
jgi:hypothetical protein